MLTPSDYIEMLDTAREHFVDGNYRTAETLLQQVLLRNNRLTEVFQMLGTIYYHYGKFNKAIKTFKRALEIDPTYTDASIGLSIILNDLGRYQEGKEIFDKAQTILDEQNEKKDPYIEEKLSSKHFELGELYFGYKRHEEALEQYFKALKLATKKTEITMRIVECYIYTGAQERAIKELKLLIKDYPNFLPARLRLGVLLYNTNKVAEAVEQLEYVLHKDPENINAQKYLKIVQDSEIEH